ncbi:MAG: DUF2442 domain-containing protein [Caldilineae bacterium]|nr:MAG: DUF2442 domain-containing protein [Caldilineae bacterium]
MSTVVKSEQDATFDDEEPRFLRIEITDEYITAWLSDGRIVSTPLWWSWRLEQASPEQRANYKLIGSGRTAYWPDVDEHLDVHGFLHGVPAPRPQAAAVEPE